MFTETVPRSESPFFPVVPLEKSGLAYRPLSQSFSNFQYVFPRCPEPYLVRAESLLDSRLVFFQLLGRDPSLSIECMNWDLSQNSGLPRQIIWVFYRD